MSRLPFSFSAASASAAALAVTRHASTPAPEAASVVGAAATAVGMHRPQSDIVPHPPGVFPEDVYNQLERVVRECRRLLVVTGAGCSTESGIPDYRSPNGAYSKGHKPVTYSEFTKSDAKRRRYWARSFTGWNVFSAVRPNPTHYGIAALQREGIVGDIITQNVDRLHQKAHTSNVIELHGSQYTVSCLSCRHTIERDDMQNMLADLNPEWTATTPSVLSVKSDPFTSRPDGDAEVTRTTYENFHVPGCPLCGGMLKPDVVFFGENVRQSVVDAAFDAVRMCDGVVAAGTSLQVYSVFRFIKAASEQQKPMCLVNIGPTRADGQTLLHLSALTSEAFWRLGNRLAEQHYGLLTSLPLGSIQ